MKPAVRQMRGPGMNLGLKKPRAGFKKPEPYVQSRELKAATKGSKTTSYLPEEKAPKASAGKKRQAPRGKASSKLL